MPRLKQIGVDVDVHNIILASRRSFSETENDILRRVLLESGKRAAPAEHASPSLGSQPAGSHAEDSPARSRGLWSVEICGERRPASNLRDAYRQLLIRLSDMDDTFLAKLSEERSRARRYVARRPEDLYQNSPHLASDHAPLLKAGWYYDTNLSAAQVGHRARVAARIANLQYGKEVRLLEGSKEI